VWIFPVLRNGADASNPRLGASIYGAVQQLIPRCPGLRRRDELDDAVRRARRRAPGITRSA
jgi:hypothetical protein